MIVALRFWYYFHVLSASLNAPVKSEALKSTKNITFVVEGNQVHMLLVVDVEVFVIDVNRNSFNLPQLHLRFKQLSRIYTNT